MQPYRTSGKTTDHNTPNDKIKREHFKEDLFHLDASFICDDGDGKEAIYKKSFKGDGEPADKEIKKNSRGYHSIPSLHNGLYRLKEFLSRSLGSFLIFDDNRGAEDVLIPWDRLIKVNITNKTSNMVEFDWYIEEDLRALSTTLEK